MVKAMPLAKSMEVVDTGDETIIFCYDIPGLSSQLTTTQEVDDLSLKVETGLSAITPTVKEVRCLLAGRGQIYRLTITVDTTRANLVGLQYLLYNEIPKLINGLNAKLVGVQLPPEPLGHFIEY